MISPLPLWHFIPSIFILFDPSVKLSPLFHCLYFITLITFFFLIFIVFPHLFLCCRRLHLPLVTMHYQYCKENHWRLLMFNHSHKFYIPLIHLYGIHTHTHTLALSFKTIERWTQIVQMHKRKEHPNTTFGKHTQTNASVHKSAYWNTYTSKHTDSGTHP